MISANAINYLTPYRWYNQYFKQSRFEKDCDMVCGFDLLVDKNHLLPFQFTRKASPSPISDWFLVPACKEPFTKLWSDADATFVTLNNWVIEDGLCEQSDPEPLTWQITTFAGSMNFAILDDTHTKVIGYTDWDTDLDTTMQKLVDSINTNTSNGTQDGGVWPQPFDNSAGFTASWDVSPGIFTINAPVGTAALYNGTTLIFQHQNIGFGSLIGFAGDTGPFSGGGSGGKECPSFEKSCGNLKNADSVEGLISSSTNLTVGVSYKLFIKVSSWANPSTNFNVDVVNGSYVIKTFSGTSQTGIYSFEFVATDPDFHIEFYGQSVGDFIVIDEVTIMNPFIYDPATDYTLDKSLLTVNNYGGNSGSDYIIYCGADLGQTIPPGTYYSIIRFAEAPLNSEANIGTYISEGYAYYFSEIITVKDFIPESSPYIKLEWYNDCDIQDVSYASSCYFNRLYIDGVLTKPEYPITEKGKTDGNEDFNPTFQKWNKKRDLQFTKVPEFLIDSLTAIRLHSSIKIWEAIRDNQQIVSSEIPIKSVEHEITWILDDCRATFNLKCLISDKVVDETCCDNIAFRECITCNVTADYYNDDDSTEEGATAVFEDFEEYEDGYYIYTDGEWVLQEDLSGGTIICIPDSCAMFNPQGGTLRRCPSITYNLFSTSSVRLKGYILENTYAQAQYSLNGTTWIDIGLPVDKAQFISTTGLQFTRPEDSPVCGDTYYRVKMFDLNCEYCFSEPVTSTDTSGC